VVPPLKDALQPLLDKKAKEQQARTLKELEKAEKIPAVHKLPVCRKGLSEPWAGLSELERSGLAIAEAARGGRGKVGLVLDRLQAEGGVQAEGMPVDDLTPERLDLIGDEIEPLAGDPGRRRGLGFGEGDA